MHSVVQTTPSVRAFGRFGCFLVIATLVLFWLGIQGIYTSLTNMAPAKSTVKEYVANRPSAAWVELADASLNLLEASYSGSRFSDDVNEVFIPVHAKGEDPSGPVHILLSTKDPEILALMEQLNGIDSGKGTDDEKGLAAISLLAKNMDKMRMEKTVSGLVQFGIHMDSKERHKLANLHSNLAKDFVIIEDGGAPNPFLSLGFLVGGLVVGAGTLLFAGGSSKTSG